MGKGVKGSEWFQPQSHSAAQLPFRGEVLSGFVATKPDLFHAQLGELLITCFH